MEDSKFRLVCLAAYVTVSKVLLSESFNLLSMESIVMSVFTAAEEPTGVAQNKSTTVT